MMKKWIAFFLAVVLLLSVLSVSSASVRRDDIIDCLGYWRYKDKDVDLILMIGYDYDNGYNAVVSKISPWDSYGNSMNVARYSISFDRGENVYYLTSLSDVVYRVKLSDGKILLFQMDGTCMTCEKME